VKMSVGGYFGASAADFSRNGSTAWEKLNAPLLGGCEFSKPAGAGYASYDRATHPLTAYGFVKSSSVSSKNGFLTGLPLALKMAACRWAMNHQSGKRSRN
jgi:hypothetical protein